VPTLLLKDHPLTEKIWDVKAKRFVDQSALKARLVMTPYILLGETHDNMDHHKHQAWALQQLSIAKRDVVVAYEMINESQGKLLETKKYSTATQLVSLLNQNESRWEYKQHYFDLFETTLKAGFRIVAANLDRASIVKIVMKGSENITGQYKVLLKTSALTPELQASLAKEIAESHCNMINQSMTEGMMAGQRVRDAAMTLALTKHSSTSAVRVLIAGSGHVRRDRGVPYYLKGSYLRGLVKNDKLLSISWLEVEEGENEPASYASRWNAKELPFDFVWFTARADRPDPCEQFKKHMHKLKHEKDSKPS